MLEKCVLTILELNWNRRLGHKKTKLNICHHILASSTQLQNKSSHVVERTRTSTKCQKMKNARAKRAKILFFVVKYANLWGFCCRRRRGCLRGSLSNHNDDGNKNPTNLHIWQWKTVFLHALHVHFSSFDILKTFSFFPRRELVLQLSGRREHNFMMTNAQHT